jgi:hypothetical protein
VLYALAGRIAPVGPADPAALALAGLTSSDRPPNAVGPTESATEGQALDRLARQWVTITAARLDADAGARGDDTRDDNDNDHTDDESARRLVAEIARRPGRVLADPGWIEIHLGLDQVRLDVRRAGLDLDPGWLPWLGAVVRFVYGGHDG